MKNLLLTLILIISYCIPQLPAQNKSYQKTYKTWLIKKNNHLQIEGHLFELKETSVLISLSDKNLSLEDKLKEVEVKNINTFKIKVRGRGKGALIGGGAGLLAGVVFGAIATDPNSSSSTVNSLAQGSGAIVFGLLGGAVGALMGTIIGPTKRTISINGSPSRYLNQKEELKKYLIKYE